MEKKKFVKTIGFYTIFSAIIWGAVIIGCSWKLKGTECYDQISNFLIGGVSIHVLLIFGPLAAITGKKINKEEVKPE